MVLNICFKWLFSPSLVLCCHPEHFFYQSYYVLINLYFLNYFQELQKQREDEIDSLKTEYNNLLAKIDNLELDVKKITASMKQMDEQMSTQTQQIIDKEESYKVKKQTMDLLPDAENNIGKIQVII